MVPVSSGAVEGDEEDEDMEKKKKKKITRASGVPLDEVKIED